MTTILQEPLVEDFDTPTAVLPASTDDALRTIFRCEKLREPLTLEFLKVCVANAKIFDKKQSDYGSKNISDFGHFGCLVRMSDKVRRLANLYGQKGKARVSESVMDNLRDIGNYCIISIMWLTGKWPK